MQDTQFRMACPKCKSYSFTVRRDQRAYVHKSQPFELVFSCRCGKQLFGEQIQEEYDRQKVIWEQEGGPVIVEEEPLSEAEQERLHEEERRKEQLRKAMEYRRKYLAEKRRQKEEDERSRREEEDRRWREKVAIVEAEGQLLRPTKPKRTTRLSALTAVPEAPGSKPREDERPQEPVRKVEPVSAPAAAAPRPAPVAPVAAPAPSAVASAPTPSPIPLDPDDIEVDPEHPHAEFMAYFLAGSFFEHFPDAVPPDRKSPDLCVWPPCEKARRKKSKYCSRECSNKNARWRHKMRKKT
ncbi:MAG: hypothetical protein H6736_06280 [Alphaproteobacteria bacterium]|nr:hypothetical protein [Alphaproteobacteria bacterium]